MKQMVLVFPDLTKTAPKNWTASCVITGNLIAALRCQEEFRTADHSTCLRAGRTEVWKRIVVMEEEAQVNTLEGPCSKAHVEYNSQRRQEDG